MPGHNQQHDHSANFAQTVMTGMKWFMLTIWTVVGLFLYIPLLVRVSGYYSTMLVISVFQKVNLSEVHQHLDWVIHMYPATFQKIRASFEDTSIRDTEHPPSPDPIDWKYLLRCHWLDFLWIPLFWFLAIASAGYILAAAGIVAVFSVLAYGTLFLIGRIKERRGK